MESITLKESDASRRLLLAFAHPDDESFGPAGTIIRYANRGVAVHYVCATRGEAGHVDPELLAGYNSLAELRTKELQCAARHLGLAGLHLLDYHDSGMENTPENQNPECLYQAPLEEVGERITGLIRQIRPQVVITFDPSGGYFHPDHVKMHQATTLAFHAAGDPQRFSTQLEQGLLPYQPLKLYYIAFPRWLLRLVARILPLLGQDPAAMGENNDIDLSRIVGVEQAVTTKINVVASFEASQRAARCYASQTSGGENPMPEFLRRWLFRSDSYTRVVPPFEGGRLERDLFAGIDEGQSVAGRKDNLI
jgi:LmbE family N-acetylglucosaminyl deacetylase